MEDVTGSASSGASANGNGASSGESPGSLAVPITSPAGDSLAPADTGTGNASVHDLVRAPTATSDGSASAAQVDSAMDSETAESLSEWSATASASGTDKSSSKSGSESSGSSSSSSLTPSSRPSRPGNGMLSGNGSASDGHRGSRLRDRRACTGSSSSSSTPSQHTATAGPSHAATTVRVRGGDSDTGTGFQCASASIKFDAIVRAAARQHQISVVGTRYPLKSLWQYSAQATSATGSGSG